MVVRQGFLVAGFSRILGLNTCTADFSLIFVFVFLAAYRRSLWTTMIVCALSE